MKEAITGKSANMLPAQTPATAINEDNVLKRDNISAKKPLIVRTATENTIRYIISVSRLFSGFLYADFQLL